jgi:hypothetical protein
MDASLLARAAGELASQGVGPASATITAFDNTVEAHLARIDEVSALIDSVRGEVAHTVDTAFPMLLQNTQELQALLDVIDRAEAAANRSFAAARAASDRLDALQAGYDTKYPEGMAKLTSWFGKSRVSDSPVKLPAWDPASARVDVDAEVAALRGAVGVAHAVQADKLAAFMAESEGLEEEAAAAAGGEDGEGGEGGAEPTLAPARVAIKALAAGEEDEEDDEDDEDDD